MEAEGLETPQQDNKPLKSPVLDGIHTAYFHDTHVKS